MCIAHGHSSRERDALTGVTVLLLNIPTVIQVINTLHHVSEAATLRCLALSFRLTIMPLPLPLLAQSNTLKDIATANTEDTKRL